MKKVIASAGMLALGAIGVHSAPADMGATAADKPWSIKGTLRGFYDDNYNTQSGGQFKRSSFGLEVSPRIDFGYSTGPTTITASYIYDLRDYFARPGNKVDQSHDVELFLNHNFNERYSIDFTESFVDSQEPEVLDPGLGAPLRANGDNLRNMAAINFHAEVTPLLGFLIGYANTIYDYTSVTTGINTPNYGTSLNRYENRVTLDSRWHLAPETVGILGYAFNSVNYMANGSLAPGGQPYVSPKTRDNYTHDIYLGVEHSFRSDLSFSARGGIQIADYYNAPAGNDQGSVSPYVDLSGTYIYMEGGSLTVGFRHSKNQTDVAVTDANGKVTQDEESSSVYGTITQVLTPISPDLTANLSAQYQNSTFNGGGTVNGATDKFFLLGLNVSYKFNRYFSTEVGYNYDDLSSDLVARGYTRNRVYIGVTGTY